MTKWKFSALVLSALVAALCLQGCSDSDSNDDNGNPNPGPSASATPVTDRTENFADGPGGNLWKPVSENNGNVVVLFRNVFRQVFPGGCYLELADGTRAPMYCGSGGLDCFTNPDRLTMRSNVKCSAVKEVKVVCEEELGRVIFTVDPSIRNQICSRHD
jgi:hypothetical protein